MSIMAQTDPIHMTREGMADRIRQLEAENAKLRERLSNSVEERAKRALGDPRVGVSLTTLGELASRPGGVTIKGGETN